MTQQLLTIDGAGRYDRQERVTWWDQELLQSARVLVVGAGALGNEVLKNLALMGVGSIVVVDFDFIELSNLARCVLFREHDDGRSKALVAAERARELNGDIEVVGVHADIRSFGTGIALRADAIVGALDNREARLYLNRLAWRVGAPWVDGAIEALEGVARVFWPPESCYECTLTAKDWQILDLRRSCRLISRDELMSGRVPTTVTSAAIVGGIESQEVVKVLHRDLPSVRNLKQGIALSGSSNEAYNVAYPLLDDCLAHHPFEDIVGVDPAGMSAAAVVESAGYEQGVLELNDDYLVGWRCEPCALAAPASGPVALARHVDALCPQCEAEMTPDIISSVQPTEQTGDVELSALALKVDEVLPVRSAGAYSYVWLKELDERLPASWGVER